MQKIVFKDKTFLEIERIASDMKYDSGLKRELYNIHLKSERTFEDIKSIFKDGENIKEFDLFNIINAESVDEGTIKEIYEGTHIGFSILRNISFDFTNHTYIVTLAQENALERKVSDLENSISILLGSDI
jgi:hypothetical protein